MGDYTESSFLEENGVATDTLERATLTRKTSHGNRAPRCEQELSQKREEQARRSESAIFWVIIGILLLLAGGNLSLTFFAMGVLRLGTGMESIEFLPGLKTTKFFGSADLGRIQKQDGTIFSYSDIPFSISGDNSKISISLRSKSDPPYIDIGPQKSEINNIEEFKVVDPTSGKPIFTTKYPNFGLPRGVKNLNVERTKTSRITSPTFSDLEVRSDSTIRLKGNEGLNLEAKKMTWTADQDIYLKTLNGSLVLDGKSGIFIEVNTLPLAGKPNVENGRGQYKLCVCTPRGQLFRVPVPADNNERAPVNQITCSSFVNPCAKKR